MENTIKEFFERHTEIQKEKERAERYIEDLNSEAKNLAADLLYLIREDIETKMEEEEEEFLDTLLGDIDFDSIDEDELMSFEELVRKLFGFPDEEAN